MESLICGCGTRSWTKAIAWIQILLFFLGLLLEGGGLMVLLVAGKDAVDKVAEDNPDLGNIYLKLIINYVTTVVLLILGIILALFLIKGATESKSCYLKCWVIYSVIYVAWFIFTEVLVVSVDKVFALIRISVVCSIYGFCIFVVVTLVREIRRTDEDELNKRSTI